MRSMLQQSIEIKILNVNGQIQYTTSKHHKDKYLAYINIFPFYVELYYYFVSTTNPYGKNSKNSVNLLFSLNIMLYKRHKNYCNQMNMKFFSKIIMSSLIAYLSFNTILASLQPVMLEIFIWRKKYTKFNARKKIAITI